MAGDDDEGDLEGVLLVGTVGLEVLLLTGDVLTDGDPPLADR